MITLITGAPGSGKTLYCIDKLIQPLVGTSVKETDANGNTVEHERRIYSNINGLQLDHEFVDAAWLEKLPENKTTGAVVVFDEVQRVWPNRPTGSKKPPAVEYLETHRHDGIDVILLTQNPQLLDPAVRALVGRHLHMRRAGALSGAVVYEWDSCSNALNFKNAFSKKPYRYSRKVYKLYKSAKVHTKQRRSLPFAVWFILLGIVGAAFLWPKMLSNLTDHAKGSNVLGSSAVAAVPGAGVPASRASAAAASPAVAAGPKVLSPDEYFQAHRPRMKGLPHTAERYDSVTQPTRAPIPAACLESRSKGCPCFTQDGTVLWVPDPTCRQIVANGYFYDFNVEGGGGGPGAGSAQLVHAGAGASSLVMKVDSVAAARHQVGAPGDEVTPMDIALASKARTGGNPFAHPEAPKHAASSPVSGKPGA